MKKGMKKAEHVLSIGHQLIWGLLGVPKCPTSAPHHLPKSRPIYTLGNKTDLKCFPHPFLSSNLPPLSLLIPPEQEAYQTCRLQSYMTRLVFDNVIIRSSLLNPEIHSF
ncbi:hypothetical protein M8J76_013230 [Diaphorina citri]|nr:hypothetical protein M8J76_013206 [Diaphorina citri]KAI5750155.1 hypothetical protein M8J76_013230 [Diaphorina citri]